jgi:hypothetical protein
LRSRLAIPVIDQILERLKKYPQLSYRVAANSITIDAPSPTGFSVSLACGRSGLARYSFTVSFDGWHEEFTSDADALNCVAFGLSDQCRLKVYRRCKIEYRWTVEYPDGDEWREDSTTSLLVFPFWRRREINYRQNHVIPLARGTEDGARPSWRKEPDQ